MYPIIVRYYDEDVKLVVSILLEIGTTKLRSTGKNIFQLLDDVLQQHSIPWKNVVCFSSDNAAVMIGIRNGVAAFVTKESPNAYLLGCPCHLLHLAAEKGAAKLPFAPGDVLIAVYYYLEKSSKRHKEYTEVQNLCCVENHAILKHVCTRWLSLEKSINRLLEQWSALVEYFCREAQVNREKGSTEKSCATKKQKLATTCTLPRSESNSKQSTTSKPASKPSGTLRQATVSATKSLSRLPGNESSQKPSEDKLTSSSSLGAPRLLKKAVPFSESSRSQTAYKHQAKSCKPASAAVSSAQITSLPPGDSSFRPFSVQSTSSGSSTSGVKKSVISADRSKSVSPRKTVVGSSKATATNKGGCIRKHTVQAHVDIQSSSKGIGKDTLKSKDKKSSQTTYNQVMCCRHLIRKRKESRKDTSIVCWYERVCKEEIYKRPENKRVCKEEIYKRPEDISTI